MRLRIRWKMMLTISLPLLVMIAALLVGDYLRARHAAAIQLRTLVIEAATNVASQLDSRLEAIRQLADSTAESLTARPNVQPVQLQSILRTHLRQNQLVYASLIAFEPGMVGDAGERLAPVLVRSPRGPRGAELEKLIDYTSEAYPWYDQVKKTQQPMWTAPYTAPYLGDQRVISYSTPFYLGEVFRGVVTITIRLDQLQELVNRAAAQKTQVMPSPQTTVQVVTPTDDQVQPIVTPDKRYAVLDKRGYVLASTAEQDIGDISLLQRASEIDMPGLVDAMHEANTNQPAAVRTAHLNRLVEGFEPDVFHWVGMASVGATGWVFTTAVGESLVMDPIMDHLRQRAILLLLGLGALMMLVMILAVRMSRPIERMADAVGQLARGDMDVRVTGVRRHDEIGQLAEGFNTMVTQLHHHVDELTRQSAEREKVDSELRIARGIQTDLLPRRDPPFPNVDEFELYGTNVPARHVAGDFYDYFFAPNNLLNIVIADVAGKGIPAAMLMAVTRTIVRNLAMTGLSPAEIIDGANRMLVEDTAVGMFVTMFLAQYDTDTGRLVYCNAGHPEPIYFGSANGVGLMGKVTAPVLGVAGSDVLGPITQKEDQLEVGETLLLYTDGATEAKNPEGKMLTEDGLLKMVDQLDHDSPRDLCEKLVEQIDQYQHSIVADDVTVLALRRRK